jgi:Fe-S oxidoreductase
LARYLGISEEPRSVLVRVGDLKEPKRSRKKTFCCGAGGGQYFYDLKIGERVNINRSKELNELKPDVVITMCPFCNQMISDGKGLISANFEVKDLAEAVAESLPS